MLIELFSLGVTAKALGTIIGSKSAISLQRGSELLNIHHTRSQDFPWGALFSRKKVDLFF